MMWDSGIIIIIGIATTLLAIIPKISKSRG
jgi:hypothetical protein